jgi:DNA-binding transcriptional LysR family regulator
MVNVCMQEVNLRSVDLNLLVILDALLEERQVTRAAEKLHMSQPAVSRALQRLRQTFSDPLLVRSNEGFDLSERAASLKLELKLVLGHIQQMIAEPEFDPHSSRQTVSFAGPDLELALYLPKLLGIMEEKAPNMVFSLDSRPADYFEKLAKGEIHFAISGIEPSSGEDQFHRVVLDYTSVALLMGKHNPLAEGEITFERYLSARHGFVSLTGQGPSIIDGRLKELRKRRKTVLRLTSFMGIADFCESSDVVFMLPTSLLERISVGRNLVMRPLPEELAAPRFGFYLYWHERFHKDPMHRWIRQQISQLVKG